MATNVWVEKYRPTDFEDIVLDPLNKTILKNIIETSYFPNLLFYGPPGTGKTTTIIQLINAYQDKLNNRKKELMIHLNASDERGIDVIRTQISQFVNSKTLFNTGMKFVILDEVDYMTKNAQQALLYLIQNYSKTVRFCLICNYISRIDESLGNEFLKLRFNQLPEADIIRFLAHVSDSENLNLDEKSLLSIQKLYKSDIRSMVNFMQSNQNIKENIVIIDDEVWRDLYDRIQAKLPLVQEKVKETEGQKNQEKDKEKELGKLMTQIREISVKYNMDKKNIVKDFLNYIIRNHEEMNRPEFFDFVENIIHFEANDCVKYSLLKIGSLIRDFNKDTSLTQ